MAVIDVTHVHNVESKFSLHIVQ